MFGIREIEEACKNEEVRAIVEEAKEFSFPAHWLVSKSKSRLKAFMAHHINNTMYHSYIIESFESYLDKKDKIKDIILNNDTARTYYEMLSGSIGGEVLNCSSKEIDAILDEYNPFEQVAYVAQN